MINELKSHPYITTWKLNSNFHSLNDLDKIPKNKKSLIHVKQNMKSKIDPTNNEFYLFYNWIYRNNKQFLVSSYSGKNINFEIWHANLEHQKRKMYDKNENIILPKNKRTGNYDAPVIFYEQDNSVFVCIITKRDYILNLVENLIGYNNIILSNKPFRMPRQPIIEWMFWHYMDDNKLLLNNSKISMILSNISSFEGNVLRNDYSDLLKGKSQQIADLYITKTIIALDDSLNSAELSLDVNHSELQFLYSINGTISVNINNTYLDKNITNKFSYNNIVQSYQKVVYIIGFIIPKLINLFYNDLNNFSRNQNKFKISKAKEIIYKLIKDYKFNKYDL